ncbi:MAG: hypothetical protein GXP38_07280, partial [Chloroflexi bacterium]|nr:hypothetical protein [Chloroflexota bacterium]
MNKRYSHLAALMLAAMVLCWPASLWAQSSPNAWRTYNRFDGLAGSWFYDIVQTKDAIWVASDEGIARFNGVWQTFTSNPKAPQGAVRALAVDAQGQLWAVAATGLARYDGQWQTAAARRGLPDTNVLSLLDGPNGQLWAGTDAVVFVLPAGQKQWKAMNDSPVGLRLLVGEKDVWASDGSRLFLWRDAHWQRLPLLWEGKEFSIHITALASDGEQGVWLGTEQTGLLYVAGNGALQEWYRSESSALPSDYVTSLFLAEDGALWVGFNGGGVGILHDKQWQQLTNVDGLAADFVTALFQDADGIFWFGTVAGISRYDPQSWQRWSGKDNAPEAIVTSFSHDPAGYLWVTTHGQGLFRFDGHSWEHFSASTEPPDQALSQFLPTDYFDLVASDANQFLPTNFLEASYIDQQGALWLGTSEAGVLRYAGGELSQWTMEDGLASDTVVAIAQTPDGVMWFATYRQGLSRWDG